MLTREDIEFDNLLDEMIGQVDGDSSLDIQLFYDWANRFFINDNGQLVLVERVDIERSLDRMGVLPALWPQRIKLMKARAKKIDGCTYQYLRIGCHNDAC